MKKKKNNYFHKVNKVFLSIYVSISCLLPVITIPVKAEDVTYYWDGFYYAINTQTVTENLVSAYNTCQRFTFNYAPSGHALLSNGNTLIYDVYWFVNSESDGHTLLSALTVSNDYAYNSDDELHSSSYNHAQLQNISIEGLTYYYVLLEAQINSSYPVRNSHIPFIKVQSNLTDTGFRYCHGFAYSADMVVDDIYSNNVGHCMTLSQLLQFNNTFHENEYFSQKVINLMSGSYYLPNGRPVDPNNPDNVEPTTEPTVEPTEEPTVEPTVEPSAPSSSSSSSQQQQQQIAEGAVQNQQTIEAGAVQNTIQSGAVQITNNTGGGVTSGLDQAAAGGFFDNVQTGFNGLKSVVQSLGQMPEAVGGFLSFLPDELLNAFYLCFSLIIPLILIKLVI